MRQDPEFIALVAALNAVLEQESLRYAAGRSLLSVDEYCQLFDLLTSLDYRAPALSRDLPSRF